MRRALRRLVQDPLASLLLCGDFKPGDHVVVDEGKDGALAFKEGERRAEDPALTSSPCPVATIP